MRSRGSTYPIILVVFLKVKGALEVAKTSLRCEIDLNAQFGANRTYRVESADVAENAHLRHVTTRFRGDAYETFRRPDDKIPFGSSKQGPLVHVSGLISHIEHMGVKRRRGFRTIGRHNTARRRALMSDGRLHSEWCFRVVPPTRSYWLFLQKLKGS